MEILTKSSMIRREVVVSYCVGNLYTVLYGGMVEFVWWVPLR